MSNDASVSTNVPLIDIQSEEFAKQYEYGVWWSMYGDEQGNGPVAASYLVINLKRYAITSARTTRTTCITSDSFSASITVGFYRHTRASFAPM